MLLQVIQTHTVLRIGYSFNFCSTYGAVIFHLRNCTADYTHTSHVIVILILIVEKPCDDALTFPVDWLPTGMVQVLTTNGRCESVVEVCIG